MCCRFSQEQPPATSKLNLGLRRISWRSRLWRTPPSPSTFHIPTSAKTLRSNPCVILLGGRHPRLSSSDGVHLKARQAKMLHSCEGSFVKQNTRRSPAVLHAVIDQSLPVPLLSFDRFFSNSIHGMYVMGRAYEAREKQNQAAPGANKTRCLGCRGWGHVVANCPDAKVWILSKVFSCDHERR